MNRYVKIAFLVIVLALPAFIFIFLRAFGNNQFDVEIMHTDGVKKEGCADVFGQYYVPDNLVDGSINKVILLSSPYRQQDFNNIKIRLEDTFEEAVKYVMLSDTNEYVRNCTLMANKPNDVVLIDSENRIRGYYTTELDEIDRLIVEVKILLENDGREEAE